MKFILALLLFAGMILLNYNADIFEVGRHMYLNGFLLKLLAVAGVLRILDNRKRFSKKQR